MPYNPLLKKYELLNEQERLIAPQPTMPAQQMPQQAPVDPDMEIRKQLQFIQKKKLQKVAFIKCFGVIAIENIIVPV